VDNDDWGVSGRRNSGGNPGPFREAKKATQKAACAASTGALAIDHRVAPGLAESTTYGFPPPPPPIEGRAQS